MLRLGRGEGDLVDGGEQGLVVGVLLRRRAGGVLQADGGEVALFTAVGVDAGVAVGDGAVLVQHDLRGDVFVASSS